MVAQLAVTYEEQGIRQVVLMGIQSLRVGEVGRSRHGERVCCLALGKNLTIHVQAQAEPAEQDIFRLVREVQSTINNGETNIALPVERSTQEHLYFNNSASIGKSCTYRGSVN